MVNNPYALHRKFAKIKERIESKFKLPSPSTLASERAKKRERTRAERNTDSISEACYNDCRNCTDHCPYNKDLNSCHKPARISRCTKCGEQVRYRYIQNDKWCVCPLCGGSQT